MIQNDVSIEDQCNFYMSKICSKCGGSHKSYQCKEEGK